MRRRRRISERARDATPIANTPTPYSLLRSPTLPDVPTADRRVWHPEGDDAPARRLDGRLARVTVGPVSWNIHKRSVVARSYFTGAPRALQVPVGIKFENSLSVVACVRRKVRREVLHALRKTRRSGSGGGRPRWTWLSHIKCR